MNNSIADAIVEFLKGVGTGVLISAAILCPALIFNILKGSANDKP